MTESSEEVLSRTRYAR